MAGQKKLVIDDLDVETCYGDIFDDAAVAADLHRFVFTSSLATIGLRDDGPAT